MELGTGRLSWCRHERISDRYGSVILMLDGDSVVEPSGYVEMPKDASGERGSLVATILEVRESTHIGDFARGLSPADDQRVGEEIVLGHGTLFFDRQTSQQIPAVGLLPDDNTKSSDWLDPRALYRCHEQTVRLEFRER